MNSEKARAIIKYIKNNDSDNDKVNKALKEVKLKLSQDKQNVHIFKRQGLTSLIETLFLIHDERVTLWLLSILTSCLLEREFQEEVHNSTIIIPAVVSIFKSTTSTSTRHRACRVIGQQCTYDLSVSQFHNLTTVSQVLTFLKDAKEDDEKESAIKTLRTLANNNYYSNLVLREKGLYYICLHGLTSSSDKICWETIRTIYHFSKWPSSSYFSQVLKGTKDLQLLSKLYKEESPYRNFILSIFLNIFWSHSSPSSTQEYSSNCKMLDYLCMANLPYMIICELQNKKDQININKEESDLIFALCKLCELDKQWKKFSTNVLPSYHGRVWMQLANHNGILLLASLISTHRDNLLLLPALLRGLLGLEYRQHDTKQLFQEGLEAKLLPLLLEIFDFALKETCSNPEVEFTLDCHHVPVQADDNNKKRFSKEVSKELLDFVESQAQYTSVEDKNAPIHNIRLSEESTPTFTYKKINKIKFRTGKRRKVEYEKKIITAPPDNSVSLNRFSSLLLSSDDSPNKVDINNKDSPSVSNYKTIDHFTEKWLTVIEYIIRLIYQIGSVYVDFKDISYLCNQFLRKLYHYLYNSPVVHPSALKFLEAVARNTTSIQPILNYWLIPKLRVDLVDGRLKKNCSQCLDIEKAVTDFLSNLQKYFNHYHQYGKCEVASRLHPLKSNEDKYSCITAFTHVIRCPKLLNTFLLEHKGLDCILNIFSQPQERDVYLYAIASLCSISKTLKEEYHGNYKTMCLYCTANCRALSKNNNTPKKEICKNQFFIQTESNLSSSCKVHVENDKDCTLKLQNKTIHFNRDNLASQNNVFGAMLTSFFKESRENYICIKDVNPLAMEIVIHFIYGCKCPVFTCTDPDVYYDLIHLAQMYFLPDLQVMAMHKFCELIELDDVINSIQEFILFQEEFLQHFLCSILTKSVSFHSHLNWIGKILESNLKETFVDNIDKGLRRLLTITSSLCNCEGYYVYY